MAKIALTGEELSILSKISVEELRQLAELSTNGKLFTVLVNIVNMVIDLEKNYAFSLNEDTQLASKHAYSRGKAGFGTQFIRLIAGASSELAKREKIQQEIKEKQLKQGENNE